MPKFDVKIQHVLGALAIVGMLVWAVVAMVSSGPEDPAFQPYDDIAEEPAERVDLGVAVPTTGARRAGPEGSSAGKSPPASNGEDDAPTERTNEHGIGNDPGPDPADVPPPPPRKIDPDEGDPPAGQLDKDDVRKGIEAVRPLVKACYEESLVEFPDAAGRVTIGFRIIGEDGEGRVEMSELDRENTDLFDERLHDCMLESVGEATFEVPEGGGVVQVTYPFQFSTGSEADE